MTTDAISILHKRYYGDSIEKEEALKRALEIHECESIIYRDMLEYPTVYANEAEGVDILEYLLEGDEAHYHRWINYGIGLIFHHESNKFVGFELTNIKDKIERCEESPDNKIHMKNDIDIITDVRIEGDYLYYFSDIDGVDGVDGVKEKQGIFKPRCQHLDLFYVPEQDKPDHETDRIFGFKINYKEIFKLLKKQEEMTELFEQKIENLDVAEARHFWLKKEIEKMGFKQKKGNA